MDTWHEDLADLLPESELTVRVVIGVESDRDAEWNPGPPHTKRREKAEATSETKEAKEVIVDGEGSAGGHVDMRTETSDDASLKQP